MAARFSTGFVTVCEVVPLSARQDVALLAACSTSPALPITQSRVILRSEARAGLVPASVFKTDEALREQRLGGFDSHALPPSMRELARARTRA